MATIFEWYVPKRVILGHSIGEISEQDIIDQNLQLTQLLDEGIAPIHLIFNLEPQEKVSISILTLAKHATYLKHPKFGWGITYGKMNNRYVRLMTSVVAQATGVRNRQFETYQEVLNFLREADASLSFENLAPPVLRDAHLFGTSFAE